MATDIPEFCTDRTAHEWVDTIVGCEDCGEHPGVRCDGCDTYLDLIWDEDPREHEHSGDRCCNEHGHHVMPHRGCILR